MMKRSSAFFAVIIVLAVVRYLARGYFDRFLSLSRPAPSSICSPSA